MPYFFLFLLILFSFGCNTPVKRDAAPAHESVIKPDANIPYKDLLDTINANRTRISHVRNDSSRKKQAVDFWVNGISHHLFSQWKKTAWDFNGTATKPGDGPIACGYFVTTLLRDIGGEN